MRQVTHALLTRPPLSHQSIRRNQGASFDLHVLGTPPAFILSQDQTLVKSVCFQFRIAWQFCSFLLFLGLLNLSIQPFLKNLLKNFQGCCLLFNYQGPFVVVSCDSSFILSQAVSLCQQLFSFFCFSLCHHRSHGGGCPDDECYNITAFWNCQ